MAIILAVGVALALLRRKGTGFRAILLSREAAFGMRYGALVATSSFPIVWRRYKPPLQLAGLHVARGAAVAYLLFLLAFLPLNLLLTMRDFEGSPGPDPLPPFLTLQDGKTLRFEGDLDGTAAAAILKALATPNISALKIDSGGGDLASASGLAEVVHARGLQVEVDDECAFACTVVLAASPTGTVQPDSVLALYRAKMPEPVPGRGHRDVAVADPAIDPELQQALDRFGVSTPGPARLRAIMEEHHAYPDLSDLDDMSLVMFVRDPDTGRLLRPWEYCWQNHDPRC
ncbi:MAG: hypothetical protein U1E45_23600 [Geminicoccaceae bacterium]